MTAVERLDAAALAASVGAALRADSPDAPSTHAEALARDQATGVPLWMPAESKELGHHKKNVSWVPITRDELPPNRRVHKLIWVYKVKRDGTAKAIVRARDEHAAAMKVQLEVPRDDEPQDADNQVGAAEQRERRGEHVMRANAVDAA